MKPATPKAPASPRPKREPSPRAPANDRLTTVQVKQYYAQKLRKIAALEEFSLLEIVEEAVWRYIDHWEAGARFVLPSKALSEDRGLNPEDLQLPPRAEGSQD